MYTHTHIYIEYIHIYCVLKKTYENARVSQELAGHGDAFLRPTNLDPARWASGVAPGAAVA